MRCGGLNGWPSTTRSGRVVSAEERLTLEQALRGITIDAAFALRMDDEIGSIVAGKRADFTVLEDDPFEFGVERLKDVRVAGTVFEGEVHLLDAPIASVFAADPPRAAATPSRGRYRVVADDCGTQGDPCAFVRQLSGWAPRALNDAYLK